MTLVHAVTDDHVHRQSDDAPSWLKDRLDGPGPQVIEHQDDDLLDDDQDADLGDDPVFH